MERGGGGGGFGGGGSNCANILFCKSRGSYPANSWFWLCVCEVGSGPGRKRCFSIIAPSSQLVMGREKKNINENFAKNCIFT